MEDKNTLVKYYTSLDPIEAPAVSRGRVVAEHVRPGPCNVWERKVKLEIMTVVTAEYPTMKS
jgi:hypothetical protein